MFINFRRLLRVKPIQRYFSTAQNNQPQENNTTSTTEEGAQ